MPICSETFERLIFNSIFEFLNENTLLCPIQSGHPPFASCENQLQSIIHDIYANSDQHLPLDMRADFLDISKAFEKAWHEGLLLKLEHIEKVFK